MSNLIPGAISNDSRAGLPTKAEYIFAGVRTPVILWGFTRRAEPLISFPDGRIDVVSRERVRVVPADRLP
jgi:hypothetical protein